MARRILIVGGGYAGALCAIRMARKTRKRGSTEIVLVDSRPWFVERVRLHQDVAGGGPRRRSFESMLKGTPVRFRLGRVAELDLVNRRARFDAGPVLAAAAAANDANEPFDEIVLATGSAGSTRGLPGLEHAWSCATEEQSLALRSHLTSLGSASPSGRARVVIVGGGLTGIELASELAERLPDLEIALVTSDEVAPMLGVRAREYVRRVLTDLRVALHENTRVVAIENDAAVLDSGAALPSDATVWCGGLEAAPLARATGLAVDEVGRAFVDGRLRSIDHDFVRVIGDAAHASICGADGLPQAMRMACATAIPQGAFCADDVARDSNEHAGEDFSFAYSGQSVSLGRRRGIIQRVDARDRPLRGYIGGRLGAWLKELMCFYGYTSAPFERHGLGYHWPHASPLPAAALPAARERARLATRSS